MGRLLDAGASHGAVIAGLATAQIAVVIVVLVWLPETAHRELEELNPEDDPHPPEPGYLRVGARRHTL